MRLSDAAYMDMALEEARLAAQKGEVPVGAVITDADGTLLARAHNLRETDQDALAHAEVLAIREACRKKGSWRLSGCTLYVTLEPCPMCAGAILHARIPRIVCGSMDPVAGAMGSVWAIHRHPVENKHVGFETGCLEEECRAILQDFFENRRKG